MINIKWIAPISDNSGYASCTRKYLSALIDHNKINLTISPVSFENVKTYHGEIEEKIKPYIYKTDVDYKINIIHLTPENYVTTVEKDKYNIAYTVWETDKLPREWIPLINLVQEVWTPSEYSKQAMINSGINKPIFVIPHIIDIPKNNNDLKLELNIPEDTYLFYSIFQWIERKAPSVLLRAYLTEFQPSEKVCLILKTYRIDTSTEEKNKIKQEIVDIKTKLKLDNFPAIRFFGDLLPIHYIDALHRQCDCFVLPHRSEGFSITHATSMSYGNPTIGTNYSGNLDFMNKQNSFLIDYQLTPVYSMIFGKYYGNMTWAEPNIIHLRQLMRYVFENREEVRKIGLMGQKYIEENLNSKKISQMIIKRLETILKGIG